MLTVEDAAAALFQQLHGHAHVSNPEWTTTHNSTTSPGSARAYVRCDVCGFEAGVAYRDPLEVEVSA